MTQTVEPTDLAPIAPALLATKDHIGTVLPPAFAQTLSEEQARLQATSDPSTYVGVGSPLANATLTDAHGAAVEVLTTGRPAVVVFYRGAWCPFCNVALSSYQREVLPVLEELDIDLVAISPQGPSGTEEAARAAGLTFPVLTDAGGAYARSLGLVFELADDVRDVHTTIGNDFGEINAGGEWALPRPTVIVTDAEGVVRFADVRADYTERTEPAAILAAVRALPQS